MQAEDFQSVSNVSKAIWIRNDNFAYFLDDEVYNSGSSVFERYEKFNGVQGNSPPPEDGDNNVNAATNIPDSEDINNDNTMSETESYYEYVIQLEKDPNGNNEIGNESKHHALDMSTSLDLVQIEIPLLICPGVNGTAISGPYGYGMFMTRYERRPFDCHLRSVRTMDGYPRSGLGDGGATPPVLRCHMTSLDRTPFRYDPLGIQVNKYSSPTGDTKSQSLRSNLHSFR